MRRRAACSRPSRAPLAQDVWLLAIGTALTVDGLTDRSSKRRKAKASGQRRLTAQRFS